MHKTSPEDSQKGDNNQTIHQCKLNNKTNKDNNKYEIKFN